MYTKSKDDDTTRNLLQRTQDGKALGQDKNSQRKPAISNDRYSERKSESEDRKIQKLDTRSKLQTSMRKTIQKEMED